jgi:hypothetical protein
MGVLSKLTKSDFFTIIKMVCLLMLLQRRVVVKKLKRQNLS